MSDLYDIQMEKKQNRKVMNRIGWALTALVVFSQVGAVIVSILCKIFFRSLTKTSVFNFIAGTLPIYFIGLPIFWLILRKIPKENTAEKSSLTIIQLIKILIISFGTMYIFNILGVGINFLISLLKGSPIDNPLNDLLSKVNILETLFFVGILAPIMEEVIFRKILLSRLRRFGDSFSIFLSALAFGMFHGNLSQFFYAVALGCILGYTVVRTGTIKYSIILHMCINIFGSVIIPEVSLMNNIILTAIVSMLVVVSMSAGVVLFILNRDEIILENSTLNLTKIEKFGLVIKNPGMILYTILFILLVIMVIFKM
ncbi:type II CAAX endopeptidase family protein [Clostridium sp. BL-8]|uniref:CPBP family intramembrane glutamic endopeptidase n=1 Tax=Clostridium sp. BL-8 TaxID=349938 RepID=UPI00098C132F|nr:type II CAAX endopeptidase family protein [Clostridium sp. BL-8]OOM75567.1 CAAX amino terminal protease self- immunity [Clostridium sp. BL-8]